MRMLSQASLRVLPIILLVNTLYHFPSSAEVCDLCKDGSAPKDPTAIFSYDKGGITQRVNCSFAYSDLAPAGEFASCSELHNATSDICGCGDIPKCSLCGDGKSLPLPSRVVAGKTCAEWEEGIVYPSNCFAWQRSLGTYCGCDISTPGYFDGYCRICDDEILPSWDAIVTYMDDTTEYCAEIEQYRNSEYNLNCTDLQDTYRGPCGCRDSFVFPTLSPETSDARSIDHTYGQLSPWSISSGIGLIPLIMLLYKL